ncbi:MAG: hypothetical protein NTNFB02_07340 [Nitrospira sp.]
MRILYTAMKYDYGRPEQGYGFEHHNFYDSLVHMGHDIVYFDYMTLAQKHGREWMNRRLLEAVRSEQPELMMAVLFKDEFDPAVLRQVKERTTTLNWFCDDHWRFDDFSRHWASCFTWVVTTALSALPKYAALGFDHVIKSQWGCNHYSYRKPELPMQYDVTFVGQPHGNRPQVIEAIRKAGIRVRVWGSGWESGRVSQEELIRIFSRSRVNLNLANASIPANTAGENDVPAPTKRTRSRISRLLDMIPLGSRVKSRGKAWLKQSNSPEIARAASEPCRTVGLSYSEQIKGRNFEVPGCGGFLLTGRADNLDQYYDDGTEVVTFDHLDDLIAKIRYYLKHEDERAAIARAGYDRTMREHTYAHRFQDIFRKMGLPVSASNIRMSLEVRPGRTQEVG